MVKYLVYFEIAIEVYCYFIVLVTADENVIAATTLVVAVLGGLVLMLSQILDNKLPFLIKANALITAALSIIAAIC